jgi:hypothetical protein
LAVVPDVKYSSMRIGDPGGLGRREAHRGVARAAVVDPSVRQAGRTGGHGDQRQPRQGSRRQFLEFGHASGIGDDMANVAALQPIGQVVA